MANCNAPMVNHTMCERKHVQDQKQPINYMKVQARMGPPDDPDESFVLHSLRASAALMGFGVDDADSVDWEQWSTVSSKKKLTIRVKVDLDYVMGGFKVSLLNVLPNLDDLAALPKELNIVLD